MAAAWHAATQSRVIPSPTLYFLPFSVSDSFADYSRRWQLLAAHGGQEPQDFPAWVKQQLGFDVEETVYNLVGA